jgi:hypothetical protein
MNQRNLDRLDELVELGKRVKQTSYSPESIAGTFVNEELANKCGTSSLNLLGNLFGNDSDYYKQFNNLFPKFLYLHAILKALGILEAARDDYKAELSSALEAQKTNIVDCQSFAHQCELVERILNRFHIIAKQIESRHEKRSTLKIKDEYDVQDLLHALLLINFEDIRTEEWTPSYAGGSSRMDFLLKNDFIVIEVKKSRKGLEARELGDQLLIDIEKYKKHPSCRTLFCFVYDPEQRIKNPRGIESDLTRNDGDLIIKTLITPRVY